MSVQERLDSSIDEAPLDLSPEQVEFLKSLRVELVGESVIADIRDATLVRFCRFHNWDLAATSAAFKSYLKFRVDHDCDSILDKPHPYFEFVRQYVPFAYHGFDNDGRPVYIERTGKINATVLSDNSVIDENAFVSTHIKGMETITQRMQDSSKKLGKRIDNFTTILDFEGLGFQHRNVIHLLKKTMEMDNANYPNRLGRVYVVNSPWVAPYLFQAVQILLPESIKERIQVISGDPKEFLPTVIPKDQLPAEYGGSCSSCAGGCLPTLEQSSAEAGAGLDVLHVSYDSEKVLECGGDGGSFNWYFECEGGYDIDFSVTISFPHKADTVSAKPVTRCTTSKGSYDSSEACKLTFRWDNNFSYFNSKTVKYVCTVSNLTIAGM